MKRPVLGSARPTLSDDPVLVARLRAGDVRAFEDLVRLHGPLVRAVALRLLRNEADANDVVQETFLSALRSLPRFRGGARIGTWLHRIAFNHALMKIRTRDRKPETGIHELSRFTARNGAGELPDETAARAEVCARVRGALDRLPEHYRIALSLRDLNELEYDEVARELGLTPNAARIRIHRARRALKKLLEPESGRAA